MFGKKQSTASRARPYRLATLAVMLAMTALVATWLDLRAAREAHALAEVGAPYAQASRARPTGAPSPTSAALPAPAEVAASAAGEVSALAITAACSHESAERGSDIDAAPPAGPPSPPQAAEPIPVAGPGPAPERLAECPAPLPVEPAPAAVAGDAVDASAAVRRTASF